MSSGFVGFCDPALNVGGLRSGQCWVHAGANGGDQPVKLGLEALHLETSTGDLGSLGSAFPVRGQDRSDGRVEMGRDS